MCIKAVFIALIWLTISASESSDIGVTTLFSQGLWASRGQAAKYAKAGIVVQGQRVTYNMANDLLHGLVDYPEMAQVSYDWSLNPWHWAMQWVSFLKSSYYGSWGDRTYHVFLTRIDLAGAMEVAEHAEAWRAHNTRLDAAKHTAPQALVLFGASRGANTALASVAISTVYERRHLKLVVLEAPFRSVSLALQYGWGETLGSFVYEQIVKKWTNYSENVMSPVRAAWLFPLSVPVAFVTSEADTTVHPNHTRYLIDILRSRGHPHLHHLHLQHSSHSEMALGNGEDQQRYVAFMRDMHHRYVWPAVKPVCHRSHEPAPVLSKPGSDILSSDHVNKDL